MIRSVVAIVFVLLSLTAMQPAARAADTDLSRKMDKLLESQEKLIEKVEAMQQELNVVRHRCY